MKAIRVRYHGPTNRSGPRYSAEVKDESGHAERLYMDQDNRLTPEDNAERAAMFLVDRLGWRDWWREDRHTLNGGMYAGDWYFTVAWAYKFAEGMQP